MSRTRQSPLPFGRCSTSAIAAREDKRCVRILIALGLLLALVPAAAGAEGDREIYDKWYFKDPKVQKPEVVDGRGFTLPSTPAGWALFLTGVGFVLAVTVGIAAPWMSALGRRFALPGAIREAITPPWRRQAPATDATPVRIESESAR